MAEASIEKTNKKDLSEQNFSRIIELLYTTLEDDGAWNKFFHILNDSIGSKYVHMFALDKQHGTFSWSNGNDLPAQGELDLFHKYQFIDPRVPMFYSKQPHDWFHDHEHFDEEFMEQDQYYQEFSAPWGLKYSSMCKVIENDQATIVLGILSGPHQGPLAKDTVDFLSRMLPHLSRVCRINLQNFIYSTQALVGHTLINKLLQPVILTSVAGDVIHVNESAKNLLNTTSLVAIKNEHLILPNKYNQTFFDNCITMEYEIKTVESSQHSTEFKLQKMISNDTAETLYMFYSILLPKSMMGAFGMRPLVMLFFYHPKSAPKVDHSILHAAFGLTPSECRMAILLAKGLSQKDIATELGLKHDTVRKQLQTIYQKTSTHQQTELVRIMLHLPSNFVQDADKTVVVTKPRKITK